MKFINNFVVLIVLLAVACVGMHLYIVEGELNDVREAKAYNTEIAEILNQEAAAIRFAKNSQYVAVMAEERATALAYKLDIAASMVATLEEQLAQATATVESQCESIRDLIDQNSELHNNNTWLQTEMERLEAHLDTLRDELEEALESLGEVQEELKQLEDSDEESDEE